MPQALWADPWPSLKCLVNSPLPTIMWAPSPFPGAQLPTLIISVCLSGLSLTFPTSPRSPSLSAHHLHVGACACTPGPGSL